MSLELIIGPMFAGKSSAVHSIVRRRSAISHKVFVIKHTLDRRYIKESNDNNVLVNHDFQMCPAFAVDHLMPLLKTNEFSASHLIIIEEGQFFPDLLEFVVEAVEKQGKDVVVVGLDGDVHRRPFGKILELIPYADDVNRLFAFCRVCADSTPARFTCAISEKISNLSLNGVPHISGEDSYIPMCRKHYLMNKH